MKESYMADAFKVSTAYGTDTAPHSLYPGVPII
jgi:hypothetical protein